MDLFKRTTCGKLGYGGVGCPCCDNGYSKKRKSKRMKHSLSQLRRTILKRVLQREINE